MTFDDDPETLDLDSVLPVEVREVIVTMVNETMNGWLQSSRGLPVTLQLSRLGLMICAMMERAYLLWHKPEE